MSGLDTVFYVALWYGLNIGYNIYNKDTSNQFPFPWIIGCISLGAGLLYMLPVWLLGVRKIPKLTSGDVTKIATIAALHTIGHFGAVLSMSFGAATFTHVVKAAEPVFSTILNGLINKSWAPMQVNLTLIPVVAGVAWSCMTGFSIEMNVNAFIGAMVSNLAFSLRSIYMKNALKDKTACAAKNLDSANVYAVYTIFAFILSIPLAYYFEGEKLASEWPTITSKISELEIVKLNIITGLFFYLYNESASLALGNLDGVAHAVCNTVKRVVIMIAMVVSGIDPAMSTQKMTGAAVAIGGTLLYAVVKSNVANAEKAKTA
eukprot:CAMPEP_0182570978 /NCGR_PEP_ID=MMETSP1324-20130603/11117_1 /TAXON_ID=236786 /ORGANISM="Florenciella sp., Strain RCC1587" /LENGTH=317 /DNA_ID=CAMNT_0024785425 /DNA_START=46 /DNA_END=999 /DNA_ORIENTATION=-